MTRRPRVAVIGEGPAAIELLSVLLASGEADVAALFVDDASGPAAVAAGAQGVAVLPRGAEPQDIDILINADAGALNTWAQDPPETVGPGGAALLCRLLAQSRDHFEQANAALDKNLAEIFFTHEFFKALTSYKASLRDVANIIADGANGMLGVEFGSVYLLEGDRLRLVGCQGGPREQYRETIPLGEGLVGRCAQFRELVSAVLPGSVEQIDGFLADSATLRFLAAVPLTAQETILGVLAIGQGQARDFTDQETTRLRSIGHMASLALQNTIFQSELELLSVTDRLTELYNHGYFQQRLDEELSLALRYEQTVSLLLFDIDYFKQFNDRFGHPKGDLVLKGVAGIIKKICRAEDVCARYGGEEFVIISPHVDKEGARVLAERVRAAIEIENFIGDDAEPFVTKTVSIGVATFPDDADNQAALIESADKALYRAKDAGRNRVVTVSGALGRG